VFERVCKERESDVAAANIILFYKWEMFEMFENEWSETVMMRG